MKYEACFFVWLDITERSVVTFSVITKPLTNILRKTAKFVRNKAGQKLKK